MANEGYVIDRHLNIKNEDELVDYLYDFFRRNHSNMYVDIDVEEDPNVPEEDVIAGYLNNLYFEITYTPKRYMALRSATPDCEEEKLLVKSLQPVMWSVDEKSRSPKIHVGDKDIIFTGPIFEAEYKSMGLHEIVWDTFDPEDSLKEVLFDKCILENQIDNFKIYHPLFDEKKLEKTLKIGQYPACLKTEFIESLDGKTEFEMYLLIAAKRQEILNLYKKDVSLSDPLNQDEYVIKQYQLNFLIQKACKMFDIEAKKPSFDLEEPTEEYIAWEKWWADGIQNAMLNQESFNEISIGKYGYNPAFRPQGSYKDLLKQQQVVPKAKDADVKEK